MRRQWKSSELEKRIQGKMLSVKRSMLSSGRRAKCKRRPRDKEEQNVLDLLCIKKWESDLARER